MARWEDKANDSTKATAFPSGYEPEDESSEGDQVADAMSDDSRVTAASHQQAQGVLSKTLRHELQTAPKRAVVATGTSKVACHTQCQVSNSARKRNLNEELHQTPLIPQCHHDAKERNYLPCRQKACQKPTDENGQAAEQHRTISDVQDVLEAAEEYFNLYRFVRRLLTKPFEGTMFKRIPKRVEIESYVAHYYKAYGSLAGTSAKQKVAAPCHASYKKKLLNRFLQEANTKPVTKQQGGAMAPNLSGRSLLATMPYWVRCLPQYRQIQLSKKLKTASVPEIIWESILPSRPWQQCRPTGRLSTNLEDHAQHRGGILQQNLPCYQKDLLGRDSTDHRVWRPWDFHTEQKEFPGVEGELEMDQLESAGGDTPVQQLHQHAAEPDEPVNHASLPQDILAAAMMAHGIHSGEELDDVGEMAAKPVQQAAQQQHCDDTVKASEEDHQESQETEKPALPVEKLPVNPANEALGEERWCVEAIQHHQGTSTAKSRSEDKPTKRLVVRLKRLSNKDYPGLGLPQQSSMRSQNKCAICGTPQQPDDPKTSLATKRTHPAINAREVRVTYYCVGCTEAKRRKLQ